MLHEKTFEEVEIKRIQAKLLKWGSANYRDYAWRFEQDPWLTLVAELFLQRTRASQAEQAFIAFRGMYPRAELLVEAGKPAADRVMQSLGIRLRGNTLFQLAVVSTENGGIPPPNVSELCKIVGIGHYTSSAWLSLHQNHRASIVDSNVARWLCRLTGRPYVKDVRGVNWVHELSEKLTPKRKFKQCNYAVLDFTMTVCTVRNPSCSHCPLHEFCATGIVRSTEC